MKTLTITCLILLFFQMACYSQSLSDLQKKKQEAAAEIEITTKLLEETQKGEKTSLSRLRLLNNQIEQRNLLIKNTKQEIDLYQESINNNSLAIDMIENDIRNLKEEYAEIIRSAYRNKNTHDNIMFLLSADDFNQAYRRYLYLKQYTNYRKKQAETIEAIQDVLSEKVQKLEEQKATRQQLITSTQEENQKLNIEKQQQNKELQELQKQQSSLRQKLNQQRQIERQLENEIQRIIAEETNKNSDSETPGFALTPEQKLLGDSFEQNKSLLPWPVERGIITEHFGIHSHPVLKNVQIRNNGINIATEIGSKARSVFNGEVTRVFGITGGNTAVIVRHGNYLSVYSNLKEVVVKTGDKVATKQNIGTIFTDAEDGNKSILKFQIWRENQKLDPEEWIVK